MCKPKKRVFCPFAGKPKMLFGSESKAMRFLEFNAGDIEGGEKLRPYYCVCCGGWHLTHKEPSRWYDREIKRVVWRYRMAMRDKKKKNKRDGDYEEDWD